MIKKFSIMYIYHINNHWVPAAIPKCWSDCHVDKCQGSRCLDGHAQRCRSVQALLERKCLVFSYSQKINTSNPQTKSKRAFEIPFSPYYLIPCLACPPALHSTPQNTFDLFCTCVAKLGVSLISFFY